MLTMSRITTGESIAVAQAQDAARRVWRSPATRYIDAVSRASGVSMAGILGESHRPPVARARHVAAWLLRRHLTLSLPAVGAALGGRHHTTALHSIRTVGRCLSGPRPQDRRGRLIRMLVRRAEALLARDGAA